MSPSVADGYDKGRLTLGRWSYALATLKYFDTSTNVHIGSFCSIAEDVVLLLGGEHRADWITTSPLRILMREPGAGEDGTPRSNGDIVIGNDVWIAYGATIASGVNIGDGAVVGMRAVVLEDVPPYAIVAGSPARVIRYRFDEATRDRLLSLRWWDWPDEQVRATIPLLCASDVDKLLSQ
jgi:acetyltransferase-like isoleucine patch superfamily enzyme